MSATMILYHNSTSRNGTKSPRTYLSEPIQVLLDSIGLVEDAVTKIRDNRNLGSNTPDLDNLQNFLEDSRRRILANVAFLHDTYGESLNKHSDTVISLILDCSKVLQVSTAARLIKVADRQNTQYFGRMENPHFDDILDEVKEVNQHIYESLRSINRRMGGNDSDLRSASKSSGLLLRGILKSENSESKLGPGEVAIDSKLYDDLMKLAENCWVEQLAHGRVVWVNFADGSKVRHQRPESAMVQELDKDSSMPNGLQSFAQLGLAGLGRRNNFGGGGLNARLFVNPRQTHLHYSNHNYI